MADELQEGKGLVYFDKPLPYSSNRGRKQGHGKVPLAIPLPSWSLSARMDRIQNGRRMVKRDWLAFPPSLNGGRQQGSVKSPLLPRTAHEHGAAWYPVTPSLIEAAGQGVPSPYTGTSPATSPSPGLCGTSRTSSLGHPKGLHQPCLSHCYSQAEGSASGFLG